MSNEADAKKFFTESGIFNRDHSKAARWAAVDKLTAFLDARSKPPMSEEVREALAAVDDLSDGSRHDWRKFAHRLAADVKQLRK